jgi:hypothetical protein
LKGRIEKIDPDPRYQFVLDCIYDAPGRYRDLVLRLADAKTQVIEVASNVITAREEAMDSWRKLPEDASNSTALVRTASSRLLRGAEDSSRIFFRSVSSCYGGHLQSVRRRSSVLGNSEGHNRKVSER